MPALLFPCQHNGLRSLYFVIVSVQNSGHQLDVCKYSTREHACIHEYETDEHDRANANTRMGRSGCY
jgi:hypothetical protein